MIIIGKMAGMPAAVAAVMLLAAVPTGAADKSPAKGADSNKKPMSLTPGKKMAKPATKSHTKKSAAKPASAKKKMSASKSAKTKSAAKPRAKQYATKKTMKKRASTRWAYHGDVGPAHWGSLNKSWHTCGAGRQQSPVNLEAAEPGHLQDLSFRYKVSVIEMIHTGHTVQANYGKGSHIQLGDQRYALSHIQFRTPSEHTVAGRSFPMEIQFVHRGAKGRTAIVSLLVTSGPANLAARELWDRLPIKPHTRSKKTRTLINARDLLPDRSDYFRYRGSLTMPPCSENIDWLVLRTPVSFSDNQIVRLQGIMGENARPVQARNGRYLLQSIGG